MQPAADKTLTYQWHMLKGMALDRSLSELDRRVAFLLLDRWSLKNKSSWPSYESMAIDLDVGERALMRAVKRLEAAGWFVVKRGRGEGHPNHYFPAWEKVSKLSPSWPSDGRKKRRPTAEPDFSDTLEGDFSVSGKVSELSPEPAQWNPLKNNPLNEEGATSSLTPSAPVPFPHQEKDSLSAFSEIFDGIYGHRHRPRLVTLEGQFARQESEQVVEPELSPEEQAKADALYEKTMAEYAEQEARRKQKDEEDKAERLKAAREALEAKERKNADDAAKRAERGRIQKILQANGIAGQKSATLAMVMGPTDRAELLASEHDAETVGRIIARVAEPLDRIAASRGY